MNYHRLRILTILVATLLLLLAPALSGGDVAVVEAAPPEAFEKLELVTGLNEPTAFRFLPDGRILITEKSGAIRVFANGVLQSEPLITLAVLPSEGADERGLLGIEPDPNFEQNGYLYVSYTSAANYNRLSRLTMINDTIDLASEVILLESNQQSNIWHHGGEVRFGPDGMLYWSMGINVINPNAQDLSNIHGKLHRINPDGTIPADNPFVGVPGVLESIWGYGIRNGFRFDFLPDGRAIVGDVGGSLWEEVVIVEGGANYGWPFVEGPCTGCPYVNPIFAYPHDDAPRNGGAITAAEIFEGQAFGPDYDGVFFYGDYTGGWIRYLVFDSQYSSVISDNLFDDDAGTVVQLTQGPDGNLYGMTIYPGALFVIQPSSGNRTPIVEMDADPTAGLAPLTVNFSSAGTYDLDGDPLNYNWDFGDGNISTNPNPTHVYTANGIYTATLTVDDGDKSRERSMMITVGNEPPTPTILAPLEGFLYDAGDTIAFDGTGFDPEDGNLPDSAFSWLFVFHHDDHTHPFFQPVIGQRSGTFDIPTVPDNVDTTWYRVYLTVTDSAGLSRTTSTNVYPNLIQLNVNSNIPGLRFTVDGIPFTSSLTETAVTGVLRNLNAPSPQYIGNTEYVFSHWSNDGDQAQTISTPGVDTSYTAFFEEIAPLPAPWVSTDVGAPERAGAARYLSTSDTYVLEGAGIDIWLVNDQFHYVYQTLSGDGEIIARVTSQTNTNAWAKAGVMIRESLDPFAPYALMAVTPENGTTFQWDYSNSTAGGPYTFPNGWVRLTRSGDTITSYVSADGVSWQSVGSADIPMADDVTIGMMVGSHDAGLLSTAYFDNVSVSDETVNIPPVAEDVMTATTSDSPVAVALTASDSDGPQPLTYNVLTEPANGTLNGTAPNLIYTPNLEFIGTDTFTFNANDGAADSNTATVTIEVDPGAAPLPAPWVHQDIGDPVPEGDAGFESDVFTVTAGTGDVWGLNDDLHYVYQPLSGNGEIIARLTSLTADSEWAKAGIIIKESAEPFAPYALLAATPDNGLRFHHNFLNDIAGGAYTLPDTWLRLTRLGDTITAASSADGVTWTEIGQVLVPMQPDVTVGLFVSAHWGLAATATFDNVMVNTDLGNAAPVALNAEVVTPIDTAAAITLEASDPDGPDPLAYNVLTQPTNGTLSGTAPDLTYTPNVGYFGPDSFTFAVNDGLADSNTATVSITVTTPASELPAPWVGTDIGTPDPAGSASFNEDQFVLQSGTGDIWGVNDVFHYVYQPLNGDGEITARITAQNADSDWAKAGVMIKESAEALAPYAMLAATPGNGLHFQYNFLSDIGAGPFTLPDTWLRLSRTGDVITAFTSTDGVTWTQVAQTTIPMTADVTIGLFTTGHYGELGTARFDNVSVSTTPTNIPPQADDLDVSADADTPVDITLAVGDADGPQALTYTIVTQPANGTLSGTAPDLTYTPNLGFNGIDTFTFTANDGEDDSNEATVTITVAPPVSQVPAPWTSQDVGTPASPGSASLNGDVFTLQVGAGDIWTVNDTFHYVWQPLGEEGEIIARVTSQSASSGWAKAGIMIKQSANPLAPYALLAVTPGNGYNFQYNFLNNTYGGEFTLPNAWMRMTRDEEEITAYVSADGVNWTQVAQIPLEFGDDADEVLTVGLFATGHWGATPTIVQFDNVQVTTELDDDDLSAATMLQNEFAFVLTDTQNAANPNNMAMVVDEGALATNGGTVNRDVTLSASVGNIVNNGNGTWTWTFESPDSLPNPQTVTITAEAVESGETRETSFDLEIVNVPPTASFANVSGVIVPGGAATFGFGNVFDPSSIDTAVGFTFAVDCNSDGLFEHRDSLSPMIDCVYPNAGVYTAVGRVMDKDGGYTDYTAIVTVADNADPAIEAPAAELPGF
ncbi:MAG: tandem-95 repeat protein [Chloroflexi bacterium]|nr:tandem-95 repeat protein [Chloroflexota bacterium]